MSGPSLPALWRQLLFVGTTVLASASLGTRGSSGCLRLLTSAVHTGTAPAPASPPHPAPALICVCLAWLSHVGLAQISLEPCDPQLFSCQPGPGNASLLQAAHLGSGVLGRLASTPGRRRWAGASGAHL